MSARPAPVHTAATATACTHVYADPTFPRSSHRESSGQAGLSPQKGGGTPTKARTERQREVGGTSECRLRGRGPAEGRSTAPLRFCTTARRTRVGTATKASTGALPSWSLRDQSRLGIPCPSRPGAQSPWRAREGERSLCGQSQSAKKGDDEMPPRSLEGGILQWLGGYTVWTEAGAHPCPLPRRPVMTHRRQQSHVEWHGYDWEQQRAWSLWVRSPSPASAKRSCASRAASLARRHICTKPGS